MAEYIEPLQRLADKFRKLDGIGAKTALRLAFCVLNFTESEAREFADALIAAKTDICLCEKCQNISTGPLCSVCLSEDRDESVICVVEDPRAVIAIEKMHGYRGLYHVLHGALSPMRHIGPDQIKIKELMARIEEGNVGEVILATNSTVEGEATAMYLARLITPYGVKISRIANGVPVGGDLEYTDEITLKRALDGRYDMN